MYYETLKVRKRKNWKKRKRKKENKMKKGNEVTM
jgi:hypothetical protein